MSFPTKLKGLAFAAAISGVSGLSGVSVVAGVVAVAVVAAVAGCAKPAATARETSPGTESTRTGEAAKTRELEEKAAGYQDRYKEIQESDMSADEKAQAASELVDEQQRTVREAEDGGSGGPGASSEGDPQQ